MLSVDSKTKTHVLVQSQEKGKEEDGDMTREEKDGYKGEGI